MSSQCVRNLFVMFNSSALLVQDLLSNQYFHAVWTPQRTACRMHAHEHAHAHANVMSCAVPQSIVEVTYERAL